MATDETRSFLKEYDQEEHQVEYVPTRPRKRTPAITTSLLVASNIVLLVICTFLAASLWSMSDGEASEPKHPDIPDPYSPANAIVEYEQRRMVVNDTRFRGQPSPEWEEHMHDLMEGTLLRISEAELKQHGFDSIVLKDGGYAAGLGVAHNLHCVKKIKQWIYHDYFYPDMDPGSREFAGVQDHADHCLDWIRQSMMCHADYAMYTIMWAEAGLHKGHVLHNEPGLQKCVNWEKLHDWMKTRSANTDMLEPPDF